MGRCAAARIALPPARIASGGIDGAGEAADTEDGGGAAAGASDDIQAPRPKHTNALLPEERTALEQWARDLADALGAADRRERALVDVAERPRRLAAHARGDVARRPPTALDRRRRHAGDRLAARHDVHEVADDEDAFIFESGEELGDAVAGHEASSSVTAAKRRGRRSS